MKNVFIGMMVIVIGVLGAALAKTTARLKSTASGPQAEQLRGYLEIVERYSKIAKDPSQTGVAAVLYTKEIFKTTPPQTAIDYFNEALSQTNDPAVKRAIRLELVELYLHRPQPDRQKALDQLRALMGATAATRPAATPTAATPPIVSSPGEH